MRGSLTFKVNPSTQAIACVADLYEMTEFDLIRIATALNEQSFKLLLSVLKKRVEQAQTKQVIQEAADFKRKVDENGK